MWGEDELVRLVPLNLNSDCMSANRDTVGHCESVVFSPLQHRSMQVMVVHNSQITPVFGQPRFKLLVEVLTVSTLFCLFLWRPLADESWLRGAGWRGQCRQGDAVTEKQTGTGAGVHSCPVCTHQTRGKQSLVPVTGGGKKPSSLPTSETSQ